MARSPTDLDSRLKAVLQYLDSRLEPTAVVLFGSHVDGRAGPESDIDLAVFSPLVEGMTVEDRIRVMAEVALHCGDDVEVHLFPSSALKNARKTNFAGYILETGKRIL